MKVEVASWAGADGQIYRGNYVRPKRPNGGGVLILHGIAGLSDVEGYLPTRFAELGYTALAVDYIGDGRILHYDDFWYYNYRNTTNPTRLRQCVQGAYTLLANLPQVDPNRIGAAGYCYGGLVAMEYAKGGGNLAGIVALHSSLPTQRPEENKNIKCKVLVLNAAGDAYVPWTDTIPFQQAMEAAGVDLELTLLGSTSHGYTARTPHDDALAPAADVTGGMKGMGASERSEKRAWRLMTDFFAETIGRR